MTVADRWVLAIDFGTSYTVAAARQLDGGRPEVIEIDGDRRVPSVVMVLDGGDYVIGRAAEESAAARPNQVLRAFKSRLGDPAPIILAGRAVQAADLAAHVFAKILAEATRLYGCAPEATHLTYPATWTGQRRQQLLRAASIAELPAPALVPEPIAAAIWYSNIDEIPERSTVLVYDLGGGTFDCALLTSVSSGLELVGRPSGERQLGGELFDELLANHIGEMLPPSEWEQLQLGVDAPWQQAWVALRREARRAKELLSTQETADIVVPLPTGTRPVRLHRAELERLVGPHLIDSVQIVLDMVNTAGLSPDDLHAIYLVGGASRMPMVERAIADSFPRTTIARRADPKTVVALGASLPQRDLLDERWVSPEGRRTDPAPERIPARRPTADDRAAQTARDERIPDPFPTDSVSVRAEPDGEPTVSSAATVVAAAPHDGATAASNRAADKPSRRPRRARRRRWLAVAAVLLVVAGAVVGVIVLTGDDDVKAPIVANGAIVFACRDARDDTDDFELFTSTLNDRQPTALTDNDVDDRYPAWNDDGSRLAWSQGLDIMVAAADGSGAVNLTAALDDPAEKPAWTPDGETIVFVRKIADTEEVWRMSSRDGSDVRPIVTFAEDEHDAFDPTVSGDGSVVYSSRFSDFRVSLYITDLDGSDKRPLGMQTDDTTTDEIASMSDVTGQITFSRSVDGNRYDVMAGKLGDIDIANLTQDFTTDRPTQNLESTWSPDGRSIIFVNAVGFGGGNLWLTEDGSGTFTQLDAGSTRLCHDPDWAPAVPSEG